MRTVAIVQARMSSSRLPGKVLRPLFARPVMGWVTRAAQVAGCFDDVVVATSIDASDDPVAAWCTEEGVACVRGPLDDVLSRFLLALDSYPADAVTRLTADCPLLDPVVIRMAVAAFSVGGVDYLSTVDPRTLPRGLDVEVVGVDALRRAHASATDADRIHVTSWLYRQAGRARRAALSFPPGAPDLRVTLDTPEDARVIEAAAAALGDRPPSWTELVAWLRAHPEVAAMNASVRQKELTEG